jgi:hypothetical protein
MNIQQLRQSLKIKWLSYYQQNHSWLAKMQIWGTYDGLRRPTSGYILATLSILEPQFPETLAFLNDLNNDPDQIVAALGLNFNPDQELELLKLEDFPIVADQPFVDETPDVEKPDSSPVREDQPMLLKFTPGGEQRPKPLPPMVVTTQTSRQSPVKTMVLGFVREPKPKRSLMSIDITSQAKTLPSLAITPQISQTDVAEVSPKGKFVKLSEKLVFNQVHMSPSTHATSLASWVDEFCEGVGWQRV